MNAPKRRQTDNTCSHTPNPQRTIQNKEKNALVFRFFGPRESSTFPFPIRVPSTRIWWIRHTNLLSRVEIFKFGYFIRWRNKIETSSLPWMLYLYSRWQPHSQDFSLTRFTTHALLPLFPEESCVREWIRIRVACERQTFLLARRSKARIRVDGQIRFEYGYVWTTKFSNPQRKICGLKNIRIRYIRLQITNTKITYHCHNQQVASKFWIQF